MTRYANALRPAERRGSSYVMVLASATVLTVIGISALMISRINTHATVQANRWSDAQSLAFSASEHALATINADANWRNALQDVVVTRSMGGMTFSWRVVDEVDGDLRDSPDEPATLLISATSGAGRNEANFALRVDLVVSSGGSAGTVRPAPSSSAITRVVQPE